MAETADLIPCPGCGHRVHRRADECPHCGYRADLADFDALLGSLATVSSILVGFGLAALVTLATDDSQAMKDPCVAWGAGCWVVASVTLMFVLVLAEFVRRRSAGTARLRLGSAAGDRVQRHCGRLLTGFVLALVASLAGVVLVSFHFSAWHGVVAVATAVAGFGLVAAVCR